MTGSFSIYVTWTQEPIECDQHTARKIQKKEKQTKTNKRQ